MKKDNKTIGITLRFWTNNLKVTHPEEGNICSLSCWDCGTASIEANKTKGIKPSSQVIQCFEDIIPAVKELFRKNGIYVTSSCRRPRILNHRRRSK